MKDYNTLLQFKICLIPYLMDAWKKDNKEMAKLLKKYRVLNYIDTSYEYYQCFGVKGIIEDLEDFIKCQGGKI